MFKKIETILRFQISFYYKFDAKNEIIFSTT